MRLTYLLFLLPFLSINLYSEELFIKALLTSAYDSPNKEKMIKKLKRGQKINFLKKEGTWVQAEHEGKNIWVMKIATSSSPPAKRKSLFSNKKVNLKNKARKRASSFSSAASVRGFMQGKKETFSIMSAKDEKALRRMESYKIKEKTALKWFYR
jgi:hypothetical protein